MKTDVVLLPGLHGSTPLFSSFVALAPPWACCLPLALPSVGGQGFDEIAEALLPELRPLEGFVLLSESFFGPIAARLADVLAQKVALLVLCNPLVEMPWRIHEKIAASMIASPRMPVWWAAMALSGGDRAIARTALEEVRTLPREVLTRRLAAAFSATEGAFASHLAPPLIGILGTGDRLVSPSRSSSVLSRVPQSTVVEMEGPHLIVQGRPKEVWAAISEEFEQAA